MAFRTGSSRRSLANTYDRALAQAESIKALAQSSNASMLAGPVTSSFLFSLLDNLIGAKNVLQACAARTGIAAFAQAEEADPSYNIGAEFTAMMNAIDAAGGWIVTNFPKNAQNFLLERTFNGGGLRVDRTFTSAETSGLRTLLTALIATID